MSKIPANKSALILGGTSDIGMAVAECLAFEGWSLILTGRNEDYLHRIANDLQIRSGSSVQSRYFDATDTGTHKTFFQSLEIVPELCVCLFGYLGEQEKGMKQWREAEQIIQVNYTGAVSILNLVANEFNARGLGTIIGVSSVAGDRGRGSNFLYGSAKAALTTYLSGLRSRCYHYGVHVATIKPGFVATRMTESLDLPASLTAAPGQVAKAICRAYYKRNNVVYVLPVWKLIMTCIALIPEQLFKRLKL
ncbi:SDR family oxidoreductase [Marinoscillum furvescens]|uniref:Short-subunit dehydrogenase n=1 Tax=Marinoscillum furvescens DSM 4134 TaxID=1122208 RepID=A0A3D9L1V4_MARFU|nr:SDR family oxidoreductase [Marinoscillum furvescens]RED97075.1 short-subunit dehydrogenase [Marinoscillum furvescens DSM 4134]